MDITSAVSEILLSSPSSSSNLLLAIRFEAPKGRVINPQHFLDDRGDNSSSFLMIFSDESDDNELEQAAKDILLSPEHVKIIAQLLKHSRTNDEQENEIQESVDKYLLKRPNDKLRHKSYKGDGTANAGAEVDEGTEENEDDESATNDLIAINTPKPPRRHRNGARFVEKVKLSLGQVSFGQVSLF